MIGRNRRGNPPSNRGHPMIQRPDKKINQFFKNVFTAILLGVQHPDNILIENNF